MLKSQSLIYSFKVLNFQSLEVLKDVQSLKVFKSSNSKDLHGPGVLKGLKCL